jgi:hypothetical protein
VEVRKGETSGSPTSPGRESARRQQQHGGKAWSAVKALMVLSRKARAAGPLLLGGLIAGVVGSFAAMRGSAIAVAHSCP